MASRTRVASGGAIALSGLVVAILVGGGSIASCLGPLQVTAVRCAAHTGQVPTEGSWVGLATAAIATGILVALGRAGLTGRDAAVALVGAAIGAFAYAARRAVALEGPDDDGTWLIVAIPVEGTTAAAWALGGGLTGLAVLSVGRAIRRRRDGGSAWESNPPRDAGRRATGVEDREAHRDPSAPPRGRRSRPPSAG